MTTTTTCDATWAAAFLTGLFNLNGPPPSRPVLTIEKEHNCHTGWLTSSGMPLQIQTIDTKGISCMEANGYTFEWCSPAHSLVKTTLYSGLLTQFQKTYAHEGAKNFYDALKQCNVETNVKYTTQASKRVQEATLSWKDAL